MAETGRGLGAAGGAPGSVAQAGLVVAAVAAGSALATASGSVVAWALGPLAAPSLVWRLRSAPRRVVAVTSGVARLLVVAVVLVAVFQSLYPALGGARVAQIMRIAALVLVPATGLALVATPVLAPPRGAVPLLFAVLVVAGFDRGAPLAPWYGLAGVGGIIYLAGSLRRVGAPGRRRSRQWARTGVVAGLAGAFAVGLALFIPWLQPRVEQMVQSSPPRSGADFSGSSRLGDVERIALSRALALRVWTDTPRKLRGRALTRFDGRAWHAAGRISEEAPRIDGEGLPADLAEWLHRVPGSTFGDPARVDDPGARRTLVAPAGGDSETLVTPGPAFAVRLDAEALRRYGAGTFEVPGGAPSTYAVVHGGPGEPLPGRGHPEDDSATLRVPEDLDPRVRALAARLSRGASSAEERLERTLAYLERDYSYSLSTGASAGASGTARPIAEFLFETKRGWCEYFATSAAILLRLQGIPTRYVTGFSMDGATRAAGHWVVRESDAHAWIEVYLPGRGWVEADPTPASDYAAFHAGLRGGAVRRALDAARAAIAEVALSVRLGGWRGVGSAVLGVVTHPVTLVLLGLAAVGALLRRRRRRGTPPAGTRPAREGIDPELAALAARVESLWAVCGEPRPAHRAPLEHLERAEERLPAGARDPSRAVVDALYRTRYGGMPADPEEIRRLRSGLEGAGG